MTHRNQLRTRAQLEDSLYAWGAEVESNTVEVYIHHLRKKLGSDFIRTVRSFGYQLGEKAGRRRKTGSARMNGTCSDRSRARLLPPAAPAGLASRRC